MTEERKVPLSTIVSIQVRRNIETYARERNTTLTKAIELIVMEWSGGARNQLKQTIPEPLDLDKVEKRLLSIEAFLKYLSVKMGTLPCNYDK